MDFKDVNPNVSVFADTLNEKGVELLEMFSEYQAMNKNLRAAKAIEYFILNGPYAKHIAHKFTENCSLEDFLNMVYDTPDCCKEESEFVENALELLYTEFGIAKNDHGKIIQPDEYKISCTTSNLIKITLKIKMPMQIIRNEYMVKTSVNGSDPVRNLLKDGNYSYFFFNKTLKTYMMTYLPKLMAANKTEFVVGDKSFDEEDNFYCSLGIMLAPSRVNFDTIDEFHQLIEYVLNEYGRV